MTLWEAFCARFPYSETEDQLKAIEDVIDDLEAGRPMDRLICGDVGFGKTEVAMRAAFIAALSGGTGGGDRTDHAFGAPTLQKLRRALPWVPDQRAPDVTVCVGQGHGADTRRTG